MKSLRPILLLRVGLIIGIFASTFTSNTFADDIFWANVLGGNFADGANWTGGSPPDSDDAAVFNLATAGYAVNAPGTTTIDNLAVRTDSVTLDLDGGTLNLTKTTDTPSLRVGAAHGDTAVLKLVDGTIRTHRLGVAAEDGPLGITGRLEVTGPNATLEILAAPENQIAGYANGSGEVVVSAGGKILGPTAELLLGRNGGEGSLTVDGPASKVQVSRLYVGLIGHGELYVRNGAELSLATSVAVATQGAAPTGLVVVETGGSIKLGLLFNVGFGGVGTTDVNGGRIEALSQFRVGGGVTSVGSGTVTIRNGGIVTSAIGTSATGSSGIIGSTAQSQGSVSVSGTSSRWTNEGMLVVGLDGTGTLDITNGGLVESARGQLGRAGLGIGRVTIDGAGSLWSIAQDLSLGGTELAQAGGGELTVQNDGRIEVGQTLRVWTTSLVDVAGGGSLEVGDIIAPAASGVVKIGTGGALVGPGDILGDVVVDGGTVAPSAGVLTVEGDYQVLANGLLAVNIGGTTAGTQHDHLTIFGAATLGGALDASLISSFTPAIGNSFTILTAPSVTGTFATTSLPPLTGAAWQVVYNPTSVVLNVVAGGLAGDFDGDSSVDAADYALWRRDPGSFGGAGGYNTWRSNFGANGGSGSIGGGAVPEPATWLLACSAGALVVRSRRRERFQACCDQALPFGPSPPTYSRAIITSFLTAATIHTAAFVMATCGLLI